MLRSVVFIGAIAAVSTVNGFAFVKQSPSTRTPTSLAASNANVLIPLTKGATVALVTPFTESGEVDVPSLRAILQYHVESETDGLCILGTTGEAQTMSMEERAAVLKVAVEEVKGIMPIMVGTGTINPNDVKAMTQQAIDFGCDASLVVTPYYVKPPQRGLIQHYLTMADMGLPVVMYNVPGRTGVDLSNENVALCAEHEYICGLKDATGNLERLVQTKALVGDKLLLYSGDDATGEQFVLQGGDGCVSVTANVAPAAMHKLMMAALRGDVAEVERINAPLKLLHNHLFCEANPIPAKWAAKRMGKTTTAYCRPPLDELDPQFYPLLEEALSAANLI